MTNPTLPEPESMASYLNRRVMAYAFFAGWVRGVEGQLTHGGFTGDEAAHELRRAAARLAQDLGEVTR